MKTIGQLFYRPMVTLVLVMVVVALSMPYTASASPSAMLAMQSDDFNRCSVGPAWVFSGNGISGASSNIAGAFSGESYLELTVPAGQRATFSTENQQAPRLMTAITDADFEVEIKFLGPIVSTTDAWKIQGILVRDNTDPAAQEWLRFDFNARRNGLNSYVGYMNPSNTLAHIENVFDLPGGNPQNNPVTMRIKYVKSTGEWTATFQVPGQVAHVVTFTEAARTIDFVPTDIGFFVGSTSTTGEYPGHTAKVDYFSVVTSPVNDDAIKLTVQTQGTGSGTVTQQCPASPGNVVNLTANAAAGSAFAGWSGAASGTQTTTSVTMDASKNVIATFNSSGPVITDFFLFMPFLRR